MADSDVVPELELLHSNYQIQVSNLDVIIDPAITHIYDTEPDAHALSYFVAKKQAIAGALRERWKQGD